MGLSLGRPKKESRALALVVRPPPRNRWDFFGSFLVTKRNAFRGGPSSGWTTPNPAAPGQRSPSGLTAGSLFPVEPPVSWKTPRPPAKKSPFRGFAKAQKSLTSGVFRVFDIFNRFFNNKHEFSTFKVEKKSFQELSRISPQSHPQNSTPLFPHHNRQFTGFPRFPHPLLLLLHKYKRLRSADALTAQIRNKVSP